MPVACFADPVETTLFAVWIEQYAQSTWFMPQASQEGNEYREFLPNATFGSEKNRISQILY